jgi:hypothetical protein
MRYKADSGKALNLLQARAACKLAEIHQLLVPGVATPTSADVLHRRAVARMAALPPAEQERLKLRAVIAYAELERLIAEMVSHLADIGAELTKVTRHHRAVIAYHKTQRSSGHATARS